MADSDIARNQSQAKQVFTREIAEVQQVLRNQILDPQRRQEINKALNTATAEQMQQIRQGLGIARPDDLSLQHMQIQARERETGLANIGRRMVEGAGFLVNPGLAQLAKEQTKKKEARVGGALPRLERFLKRELPASIVNPFARALPQPGVEPAPLAGGVVSGRPIIERTVQERHKDLGEQLFGKLIKEVEEVKETKGGKQQFDKFLSDFGLTMEQVEARAAARSESVDQFLSGLGILTNAKGQQFRRNADGSYELLPTREAHPPGVRGTNRS